MLSTDKCGFVIVNTAPSKKRVALLAGWFAPAARVLIIIKFSVDEGGVVIGLPCLERVLLWTTSISSWNFGIIILSLDL